MVEGQGSLRSRRWSMVDGQELQYSTFDHRPLTIDH
jgi:hypothetical protein